MNAPTLTLTGKDTIAIDGVPMINFGPGIVFQGEFPNDIATVEIGKNGNVASALNANGLRFDVTLRTLRGSPEDIYLSQREAEYYDDPPSFIAYQGNFVKRIGDGGGNVTPDTYLASAGVPRKLPGVQENTTGDTTQAVAEHMIIFGQAIRALF